MDTLINEFSLIKSIISARISSFYNYILLGISALATSWGERTAFLGNERKIHSRYNWIRHLITGVCNGRDFFPKVTGFLPTPQNTKPFKLCRLFFLWDRGWGFIYIFCLRVTFTFSEYITTMRNVYRFILLFLQIDIPCKNMMVLGGVLLITFFYFNLLNNLSLVYERCCSIGFVKIYGLSKILVNKTNKNRLL